MHFDQPNRIALIIGIDSYDRKDLLESLPACKNDANDIHMLLKDRYTIIGNSPIIGSKLAKGTGWMVIRKAIVNFFKNAKPSDTVLFYFSGHGVPKDDDVYLATPQIDPNDPLGEGFSLSDLAKVMNSSKSRRIVSIIDACFSGSAQLLGTKRKAASQANANTALAYYDTVWENVPKSDGKILLLSSQAYESSLAKKSNSVYTEYILKGLGGVKRKYDDSGKNILEEGSVDELGNVTPETLHDYVYNNVANRYQQIPKIKGDRSGKIVLVEYPELSLKSTVIAGQEKSQVSEEVLKHLQDADKLFYLNEWKDATAKYEQALLKDPKNLDALNRLGEINVLNGKFTDAIQFYKKALEIDKKNVKALNNLGLAYLKMGKKKLSISCYEQAVKLNPNNSLLLNTQFQLEHQLVKGKSEKFENRLTQSELLNLRERIKAARIPTPKNDNLRLLTWNIRNFSDEKEDRAITYIAEICKNFDIIAIQEVKRNLGGLENFQSVLGTHWRFLFSEPTSNQERFAFAYNSSRVQFTGFAAGIVVNPGGRNPFKTTEFLRTPYMASFRINGCNFVLVNVDFAFGMVSLRIEECRNFARYLRKFAEAASLGADIIGCGKFLLSSSGGFADHKDMIKTKNLKKYLYDQVTSDGFVIPEKVRDMPSNLTKTQSFDSIGYQKILNSSIKFTNCGTIDFVGAVYEGDPKMCYKLTDHLPLWAEFKTKPNKSIKYINP